MFGPSVGHSISIPSQSPLPSPLAASCGGLAASEGGSVECELKTDKMAPFEGTKFEMIKSCEDKREYRGYVLPNQMKVLLVSDPSTEKSAAAVDVHVGE